MRTEWIIISFIRLTFILQIATATTTKSNSLPVILDRVEFRWLEDCRMVGQTSLSLGWSIYQLERIFTWFIWIVLSRPLSFSATFNRLDFTSRFTIMYIMYTDNAPSLLLSMNGRKTYQRITQFILVNGPYIQNQQWIEYFLWECNFDKLQLCSTACKHVEHPSL